jgi:hypothetical protein
MDYLVCNYPAHKKKIYMWWIILFENPKQNIKKIMVRVYQYHLVI